MARKILEKDLINKRFGKLVVVKLDHAKVYVSPKGTRYRQEYYLCKCDCGKTSIVNKLDLTRKRGTKSCGCASPRCTKHGFRYTRIYHIWIGIKNRCLNKKHEAYDRYGGRGITICQEWLDDFMNFCNWAMANGYRDDLTINRIDTNGNYEPSNCRWVTVQVQNINQRISKRNKTGVRGVSKTKYNTYTAMIGINKKYIHLGTFNTIEEAIKARKEAEKLYYEPLLNSIKH